MHSGILKNDSKWAKKLEGSFIKKDLLKSVTPPKTPRLYINGSNFNLLLYGYEWLIEKYIIREKSIIVTGPSSTTFMDPISPKDLRQANVKIINEEWKPMLNKLSRLNENEYQQYAVLTMCRLLFFFTHEEIVSKKVAAKWIQKKFSKWNSLVENALNWRDGQEFSHLDEAKDFIKFAIEFTETKGSKKDDTA